MKPCHPSRIYDLPRPQSHGHRNLKRKRPPPRRRPHLPHWRPTCSIKRRSMRCVCGPCRRRRCSPTAAGARRQRWFWPTSSGCWAMKAGARISRFEWGNCGGIGHDLAAVQRRLFARDSGTFCPTRMVREQQACPLSTQGCDYPNDRDEDALPTGGAGAGLWRQSPPALMSRPTRCKASNAAKRLSCQCRSCGSGR